MRDSQRGRLYSAEQGVSWGDADRQLTLPESQRFVDQALVDIWWRNRSSIRSIEVKAGARNGRAWAGGWEGSTIRTSPGSRKPWVLVHELAHHLTQDSTPHGAVYAANYVALVRRFIGEAQANDLRQQFRLGRVKCRGAARVRSVDQRTRLCDCGKRFRPERSWRLRNINHRWCSKRCLMVWVEKAMVRPS
jgi:putative metallohydrolase (TIGR04338 family)